jgi:hypothetical protein
MGGQDKAWVLPWQSERQGCAAPHTVLFGRIGLEHWGVYDVTITILHQLSFTYFFEINLSLLGLSV